jgi:aminoglycoside phosphotransferase (APT) family kinase protein
MQVRRRVLPTLRRYLTDRELTTIERWWEEVLADPILDGGRRALTHRDLWYGNILIDERARKLVAAIDWEKSGRRRSSRRLRGPAAPRRELP